MLRLRREQEESLFALEKEYQALLLNRRQALLNFIRSNSSKTSTATLRTMHTHSQEELDAFLKVRVFDGWQAGQLKLQLDGLLGKYEQLNDILGDEKDRRNVSYIRAVISYLISSTQ